MIEPYLRRASRVTAFAIVIARVMGMPRGQVENIARGACLHDIGTFGPPDGIIHKNGGLEPSGDVIIPEHCVRGYKFSRLICPHSEVPEIVYSHHEHYDGSGYPRGLKGTEIPVGARIFAVVDAFDVMTSDPLRRAAMSFSDVRREMRKASGRQFDPAVVEAFLSVPDGLWDDLRREVDKLGRN